MQPKRPFKYWQWWGIVSSTTGCSMSCFGRDHRFALMTGMALIGAAPAFPLRNIKDDGYLKDDNQSEVKI
ncbi:hypothetical protein [uncultured Alistipes sp.]|uniref:hypothetical protein n=1 Tax=uncultured Alistipes sp. TaxID=538949 RepID=UPI00261A525F|nr:hypothetical protein [uncultured Alistipes sp.]